MSPRILIIDDDRSYSAVLTRALTSAGYDVRAEHDGPSGIAAAREFAPDLIFLDLILPKVDGFATLSSIRGDRELPVQPAVLLLSGCSPTPHYQRRAHELGASALLTKPVPLDELLTLAEKTMGSGPPTRLMSPSPGELTGSLEDTPLPALLHHLHGLRASGVLLLEYDRQRRAIELRNGVLAAVQSNLRSECLGNLLASTGKISWDVMHESLRRMERGEGLQGQILVAMHMLDENDLAQALRGQAEEKLFQAFSWRDGSFRFESGATLRSGNRLVLKTSMANAIMQGVRTRTPFEVIEAFLEANLDRCVARSESPFYRFQEIDLTADEEQLLAAFDGEPLLGEVIPHDEGLKRSLYGFVIAELVELRCASSARSEAPTTSPSATGKPAAPAKSPSSTGKRDASSKSPREAERPLADPKEGPLRDELASMADRFRGLDYFGILDVPTRSSDEEVRRAYVALAKRTHPDRLIDASPAMRQLAEEVFGLVSEAYEALADHERRMAYLKRKRTQGKEARELDEGRRALAAELAFQKGQRALERRDALEAVRHFDEAVSTYPEEGEYLAHAAWAAYLAAPEAPGRVQDSLERLLEARKLAPEREKIYLYLGKLYKVSGRAAIAERMFTRAVTLDPDCVEAVRELRLIDMRRAAEKRPKKLLRKLFGG